MSNSSSMRPVVPFLFAVYIAWGFGYETVVARLRTEVEGVVVSRRDIPSTGAPRYATEYVVRGSDGQDHLYVAGATDADLPRSMPVGTEIKKLRWRLSYERDGREVGFPVAFYSAVFGVALSFLIWSFLLLRGSRISNAQQRTIR
jgi:hypothetical protein